MTKEDWKKTGKLVLGITCCIGGTVPLAIASIAAAGVSQVLDWGSDRLADGSKALLELGTKFIDEGK